MSAPLIRPHVTYEELRVMVPEGTLCEVFDGEVYMTPSPGARHQVLVGRIFLALETANRDRAVVLMAPIDVVLAADTTVQPDVLVVLPGNRSIVQDVVRGVPDLVVEVLSPSTARRDRGIKMETYARHSVPELWMVADEAQTLEVFRLDPAAGLYRLEATLRPGDQLKTPSLPALSLEVTALFE
jgi:Uma2 family endonuclease